MERIELSAILCLWIWKPCKVALETLQYNVYA
jgi:hypothetical protein